MDFCHNTFETKNPFQSDTMEFILWILALACVCAGQDVSSKFRLDFRIFSLTFRKSIKFQLFNFNVCMLLIGTNKPQPTLTTAKKTINAIVLTNDTIETASRVFALYDDVDARIPWADFRVLVLYFDEYSDKYSSGSAPLIDNIKILLTDDIDYEHTRITRYGSEWCSSIAPLLQSHNELFAAHSEFKAETQLRLLQLVLNATINRLKLTKSELDLISKHFSTILKIMPMLFHNFENDFDEKSKFFQKLCKIENKGTCSFGLGKNKKVIAKVKDQLATVSKFYINFNTVIGRTTPNIHGMVAVLNTQLDRVAELIDESGKLPGFMPIPRKTIEAFVNRAERLIGNCTAYSQRH